MSTTPWSRRSGRILGLILGAALAGFADAPAAEAQEAAQTTPGAYSYSPSGRRDPFASLLGRGSEQPARGDRAAGLKGLALDEVALKGIILTEGDFVAMVQAPDGRTYVIRRNHELLDARVKVITADAVVFTQQLSDPLSLVKEREVRKPLRAREEGQ